MLRFAANLSWMLQEIPILDRFATARGLGFEAVECQLPYDHPAEELARACGNESSDSSCLTPPPATWRVP
jgi:hydroxypyruvate isomerase